MLSFSQSQAALTLLQIMIKLTRIASVPILHLTALSCQMLTYNPQRLVPIYSRASPAARKAILGSSNLDQSVLLHCTRLLHIPPLSPINQETHKMLERV
jgi:hypothetical protein